MEPRLSRRGFLALAAAAGIGSQAGCHRQQAVRSRTAEPATSLEYTGPSLTLTYWNGFTAADGATMLGLVREFNRSHVTIRVDSRTYPWPTFYGNLGSLARQGLGPDVGVMQADHLAAPALLGQIAPLHPVVEALQLNGRDFLPQAWRLGEYQGTRYGIPLDLHCLAMFYNKVHFARAGIVVAPFDALSFDEACRRLREAGYVHPSWMPTDWPAVDIFSSLLWQYGGEPFSADGKRATFDTSAGVAALTWMLEEIEKNYSPGDVEGGEHWHFFTGRGRQNSIEVNGIWQSGEATAAPGLDYGLAPVPTIGEHNAVWGNSHQLFMSTATAKDPHRRQAAAVFLDFLLRQSGAWAGAGMIPARNAQRDIGLYKASRQHILDDQLSKVRFMPTTPGLPATTAATLEAAVRAALRAQLPARDVPAVLRAAARRADEMLAKARSQYAH